MEGWLGKKLGVAFLLCLAGTLLVVTRHPDLQKAGLQISQVHLAYSYSNATHTSMYVVWHTHEPVDYCLVRYRSPTVSRTFLVFDFTHDLSEESHRNFVYKAHLAGLEYRMEYNYVITCVGGGGRTGKSGKFSSNPGKSDDVTVLIVGDWATAGRGREGYMKHAQTPKPNILSALTQETGYSSIWHLGDLAYNLHNINGQRGDSFFESIEPIVQHVPFMSVPGNHEVRDRFFHYNSRLEFPSFTSNNLYYSVNVGRAHFVMICTDFEQTVPGRELSDPDFQTAEYAKQRKWLIADLKSANKKRGKRPWIVVMGHKPLYCSANPESDMMQRVCIPEAKKMRESFEDLFLTYSVDLYISGHLHLYERLYPVIGGLQQHSQVSSPHVYTAGKAPIYLINGVAGNLEGESIVMKPPKQPLSYSAVISESLGYGLLHIVNSTHLWYEQLAFGRTQFDDVSVELWPTKRVEDYLWVVRTDSP